MLPESTLNKLTLREAILEFLFRLPPGKTATRYAIFVGLQRHFPGGASPPEIKSAVQAIGPDEVAVGRGDSRNKIVTDVYQLTPAKREAMAQESER